MKLSLRALALLSILKTPKRVEDILEHTTDNISIVENTLRELKNRKIVVETDGRYVALAQSLNPSDPFVDQEERIYRMFYKTKPYSIIAWFLAEEEILLDDSDRLRRTVNALYEPATMLQWIGEEYIYKGYEVFCSSKEYEDGQDNDVIQVCVARLQRLYGYATRARGY